MPKQWVTVATIAGVSGRHILNRVKKQSEKSLSKESSESQKLLLGRWQRFAELLKDKADRPPVTFYATYMDLWSSGYIFIALTTLSPFHLACDEIDILCYDLRQRETIRNDLKRVLRQKRISQETQWYAKILLEAANAWNCFDNKEGALVVIRNCVGPLVEDEEVAQSLTSVPSWLKKGMP